MIQTNHKQTTYLGHDYDVYSTDFTRKSEEKILSEATKWMKEHSKTFMQFEFQEGEFMTGCYVARHKNHYINSESHYNGSCVIGKTESGKSWTATLTVQNIR